MAKQQTTKTALSAEILSVGTELLLGDILNTNTKYLSTALAKSGVNVFFQTTVGDNVQRLEMAVKQAIKRSDVVITTGGLGPTDDDLTKEIVAKSLGLKLAIDDRALNDIENFFAKAGKIPTENNVKQAFIPVGSRPLYNKNGTAPGVIIEKNGKIVILLPGPPKEMIPMFDEYVAPILSKRTNSTIYSQTLHVVGIGESLLAAKIPEFLENPNPTVAVYAKTGEVHLRITAKERSKAKAIEMCSKVALLLKEYLGEFIYSYDDMEIEDVVIKMLIRNGKKLATAESCTGGLISKKLTDVPGSSKAFDCGIISYGNNIKADILNVSKKTLDKFGAVSLETAVEMAKGVLLLSGADIALSVTGVAGPDGGTPDKPVGLVYLCLCDNSGNVYVQKVTSGYTNGRDYIRQATSLIALDMVRKYFEYPELINKFLVEGTPKENVKLKAPSILENPAAFAAAAVSLSMEKPDVSDENKFVVNMERPYIEQTPEDIEAEQTIANAASLNATGLSSEDIIEQFMQNRETELETITDEELNAIDEYNDDLDEFEENLPWYKKLINNIIPLRADSKSEIIRKLILIIAVPVFIISGIFVAKYYVDSYNNAKILEGLKDKYSESITVPQNEKDEINYPSDYLDSFFELYKENKDIKGYIKIDGTSIDFPVVQYTDNDYYLRRDFNKVNNDHGIPFFDYRVDLKRPATNLLIYGHNMHDKQMFNELLRYQKIDYYKAHPVINMDTVYEKSQWKVFAGFIANASDADGPVFQYHNFINCTNEKIYKNFINEVMVRSIIETGVDVKYGDQLLTLSTCTYEIGSGRFVLMARKLRPGESSSVNTSVAKLNPTPLYPDKWYEKFPNTPRPDGSVMKPSGDYIDNSDNPVIDEPISNIVKPPTSFEDISINQPPIPVTSAPSDSSNQPTTSPPTDQESSNNTTSSQLDGSSDIPPIDSSAPPVTSEATPPPDSSDAPVTSAAPPESHPEPTPDPAPAPAE